MSIMQVSRKTDYALRAVIHLAFQEPARPVSVKEIAKRRGIPTKFLEKIIQDLIRKGIVHSHRGAHGGYTLAKTPHEISFRDVIEAVEGPILLNVCVSERRDCSVLSSCNMQRVWQEGQRRVVELFSDTTLADLVGGIKGNPMNMIAGQAV